MWRHAFVPTENVHRWKRCGCGHPQHPSMCRFGDTLNYCHCTAVTSREDIAALCRESGGCPEHPVPADAETTEADALCADCDPETDCVHGCRQAADDVTRLGEEMEPEAPDRKAEYERRLAEMCFGTTDEDEDEPEAPECALPARRCPDRAACGETCGFAEQLAGIRPMPRRGLLAPRRPPYVVAYEIGDGRYFDVVLAGDAVATVEDGVVKISHPEGVKALIQVRPKEGE